MTKATLQQHHNIKRAALIRLEHPDSREGAPIYLYYTDFGRDITIPGTPTYKANVIKSVGNIKFSKKLTAHKTKITFTGLDEEQLDIALNTQSSFLQKSISIDIIYMDVSTEQIVEGPISVYQGLITNSNVNESISGNRYNSTIEWECANHFHDFEEVVGRLTDDQSHRGLIVEGGQYVPSDAVKRPEYAFDLGFAHANRSISVLADYQTQETRYKLKKKSSWFGIKKSYSLEQYTEVVEKEVDLKFDLMAKYIPIVYGVQKVPGIPVFADTEVNDPSSVWVVYAFAEGEIEGFLDVYMEDSPIICYDDNDNLDRVCFGRKKVNGDTINNSVQGTDTGEVISGRDAPSEHGREYVLDDGQGEVRFWTYHGKSDQSAAQVLVDLAAQNGFYLQNMDEAGAEYWDENYKMLDTAYIVFNFKLSDLNGGRTDIPSIEAEVKGKMVDIVSNGTLISTAQTSTNMAWQLLDFLRSNRYGPSISFTDIDLDTFEDVANKFDAQDTSYEVDWVPFWRYLSWNSNTEPSERSIMQTNVVIESEKTVFKNLSALLNQVDCSLNRIGAKYVLKVESDDPAVTHIDMDTEVQPPIKVSDLTGKNKYNTVTASIADPADGWSNNSITFYNAEYKDEDKGVEKKLSFNLPYITNYYTARTTIERELRKSRFSRSVTFPVPFYYINEFAPNDNVELSYKRYGWDHKRFVVDQVELRPNGVINLTVMEFPPDVFITSGQADVSENQNPSTSLSILPARDLSFSHSSEQEYSEANVNGTLSWLPSLSSNTDYYTVYWEGAPSTQIIPRSQIDTNGRVFYDVQNLAVGTYVFTVRAVSNSGSYSAPVSLEVNIDPSKYLPDVANFRVLNLEPGYSNRFINNYVALEWEPIVTEVNNIVYRLQIFDSSDTLIREFTTINSSYTYDYESNKTDYQNVHGSVGASRELGFRIRAEGDGNSQSYNWSEIE